MHHYQSFTEDFIIGTIVSKVTNLSKDVSYAYDMIFNTLSDEYPYLVKCNNFIPDIIEVYDGMTNYERFNIGRRKAFENAKYSGKPSACGLGAIDEHLTIHYLISKYQPIELENKRQVAAYEYPSKYGSPLFSRATVVNDDLYISGTASIIGSDTVHVGDVVAQFKETVNNIKSLIGNRGLDDFYFVTYVKRDSDVDLITSISPFISEYVVCDICRDDLLVEVEATSKNGIKLPTIKCR